MHALKCFLLITLFGFASCTSPSLSVQTEFWNRSDLASVRVQTPDPDKNSQLFGQHIYIYWTLPSSTKLDKQKTTLQIKVRLQNGELFEKIVLIDEHRGVYCYPIVGDDFSKKGGLLSYLIELVQEDKPIAASKHTFWVDKVVVN